MAQNSNGLMIQNAPPRALLFDKCLVPENYRYDFTEWTLNSAQQPASGIVVEKDRITITKFRPNTWFIKSNYQLSDQTDFLEKFYNVEWILSGLVDNTSKFVAPTEAGYKPWGLVISPIAANGHLLSIDDGGQMVIYDGYFKAPNYGAMYYGYVVDGTPKLYNYPAYNSNYPEVCLGLFTTITPDDGDYVTLTTPIVIRMENLGIVDPTTVEGYTAALGGVTLYEKPMTFENVLMAHKLAFKEIGTYTEPMPLQSAGDPILSRYGSEQSTAFVISTRNYKSLYDHIRLPEIVDLGTLVQQNFPFKFWAQLERDNAHSHIWRSIWEAFYYNEITDKDFAEHLFCKSTGDIDTLRLTFNVNDNEYINIGNIFNGSSIAETIYFIISHGILKSLHNSFRFCVANSIGFNKEILVSDWTGAFEGARLGGFPTNLGVWNEDFPSSRLSAPTCDIHYAADGAHLSVFGNYKNQSAQTEADKYYTMVVWPECVGAFSRSEISEIKYILDMKFVAPALGYICESDGGLFNAVFNAPDLVIANIKNLNKGDWYLDGQTGTGIVPAGNLEQFDEDSVTYLLSNVFDLRQNTTDTDHFERTTNSFNSWNVTGEGWKMPTVFEANGNCTISRAAATSLAGTMKIRVSLYNCTLTVTDNGQTTSLAAGDHTLNLAAGETIFTVTKNTGAESCLATIELTDPFRSELTRNLSHANLYVPADWGKGSDGRDVISQSAWEIADERGWSVYVGGQLIDSTYFNE